jgi:hypothetical protein
MSWCSIAADRIKTPPKTSGSSTDGRYSGYILQYFHQHIHSLLVEQPIYESVSHRDLLRVQEVNPRPTK